MKNSNVRLSVIVPVYNVAQYMGKCLDSLLRYEGDDMEVVLVDDGSKDESGAICDEYANVDKRIRTIHKLNGGVSTARNAGLDASKGKYVWFVDADDEVKSVDEFTDSLCRSFDFAVMGCIWNENGKRVVMEADANNIPYNLWRCVFDRKQLENYNIRFTAGRKYAEDQEFILKYMMHAKPKNIFVIRNLYYEYFVRAGSAITKKGVKGKHTKDLMAVIMNLICLSFTTGDILRSWFWLKIKDLLKTMIVFALR